MNALIDTNVWLDIFLVRQPFAPLSGKAISLLDRPEHGLFAGTTTVTTIFYLVARAKGRAEAHRTIETLLDRCLIAPVDEPVLRSALDSGFDDYEDAVLHGSAQASGLDTIITRNPDDFQSSKLRVYTPREFIASRQS